MPCRSEMSPQSCRSDPGFPPGERVELKRQRMSIKCGIEAASRSVVHIQCPIVVAATGCGADSFGHCFPGIFKVAIGHNRALRAVEKGRDADGIG